jgi:hypothetical protein
MYEMGGGVKIEVHNEWMFYGCIYCENGIPRFQLCESCPYVTEADDD